MNNINYVFVLDLARNCFLNPYLNNKSVIRKAVLCLKVPNNDTSKSLCLDSWHKAQKKGKKPCLKTTVLVERRVKQVKDKYYSYTVDLLFNTDVVFKRRVVAYDMFNFVVDIGSSLGLWLGLSILNITDAIIRFAYKLNLKKLQI